MIKLKDLLLEGLSQVLYHSTSVSNLYSMLKGNYFNLSVVLGTTADLEQNRGKFYFMSFSRIKHGGFSRASAGGAGNKVTLVINGRKLGNNYKGNSVDYWGQDFKKVAWEMLVKNPKDNTFLRNNENEERLFTNKGKIPNAIKYIKEIHILAQDDDEYDNRYLPYIDGIAHSKKTPIYYYKEEKHYNNQFKRKAFTSLKELKFTTPPKQEDEYDLNTKQRQKEAQLAAKSGDFSEHNYYINYISKIAYIIKAKSKDDLFKFRKIYDLSIRITNSRDRFSKISLLNTLSADFHNYKNNKFFKDDVMFITKFMAKNKAKTLSDLIDVLYHKISPMIDVEQYERTEEFYKSKQVSDGTRSVKIEKSLIHQALRVARSRSFKNLKTAHEKWFAGQTWNDYEEMAKKMNDEINYYFTEIYNGEYRYPEYATKYKKLLEIMKTKYSTSNIEDFLKKMYEGKLSDWYDENDKVYWDWMDHKYETNLN